MEQAAKAYFWRGPITSEALARRIIRWTGWVFVAFALYQVIATIRGLISREGNPVADIVVVLLLAVPSVTLLRFKSRVGAGVLFALSLLAGFVTLASALYALGAAANWVLGAPLVGVSLFWALLSLLAWRGLRAAIALRRIKHAAPGPDMIAGAFE